MIRVLSYPPRHPYVDRLEGGAARLVCRDEPWPLLPHFYDPDWIRSNTERWEIAHLHFTWEQHPLKRFCAVLDAHHAAGRPVVWTAHDLRNPHTPDPALDEGYLSALAERADAVTTLTTGAAREVERRFGRRATVLPHGPLIGVGLAARLRTEYLTSSPRQVLVHAKSLRRNLDVRSVAVAARVASEERLAVRVVLALHDEPQVRARLDGLPLDGVDVLWHHPWTDLELSRAVATADALLLPYLWGTHSGLVELAADVGTPVLAARVGHLDEQVPVRSVGLTDEGLDVPDLVAAFRDLAADRLPPVAELGDRDAARRRFLDGHRTLYASLTT